MDTDAVLQLLKDVAAEVITPRFRDLERGDIMEKRPGDLVTIADHEAEELITKALLADDPSVLVVGEEATSANPRLMAQLAGADHAYTVDPVDGTRNFVYGRANHAVMVAELRHGQTVRAWIWQPELGHSYVAERGAGAYEDGVRMPQAWTGPDDPAAIDPSRLRVLTSRPAYEGLRDGLVLGSSAWCCGVDYPWLARGDVDAIMYSNTLPWDHAPGSLLVEETGGVVRRADGSQYSPGETGSGGLLAAGSDVVWQLIANRLTVLFR